jgi:hypothetical protein
VQLFGPLVQQVHLLTVAAPELEPSGMPLDGQERAGEVSAPTCARRFASCSRPLSSLQTNSTAVGSQTTAADPTLAA